MGIVMEWISGIIIVIIILRDIQFMILSLIMTNCDTIVRLYHLHMGYHEIIMGSSDKNGIIMV